MRDPSGTDSLQPRTLGGPLGIVAALLGVGLVLVAPILLVDLLGDRLATVVPGWARVTLAVVGVGLAVSLALLALGGARRLLGGD